MSCERHFDFLVIGAGIAGASLAYELSHNAHVCLFEAEPQAGYHATGRSAALYAPSYGGVQIRAASRASRRFFDRPPAGFCEAPLLTARGVLYIARSEQLPKLRDHLHQIRDSGGSVSTLSAVEALTRVPLLRKATLAAAVLDSGAMDIDVAALHLGYLRGARAAGAVFAADTRVERISRSHGNWHIPLKDGLATARVLVNAAGAWAEEVAALCGASPLGLQPLRRTAVLVDAPAGADIRAWPAVIDADESFYFKPDAGKLLLSPADETPAEPGDAQPQEMDIALCVDRIEAAVDIEVRRIRRSWAGLRTFAPDRIPVLGFDPKIEGFFWCAGQGGYGVQTAPALARMAAALLTGMPEPDETLAEGLRAAELAPGRLKTPCEANPKASAGAPTSSSPFVCSI